MFNLKEKLLLSDKGYTDLKKSIATSTLNNLALMLPFIVTIQIISELMNLSIGEEISWVKMWILFGLGILCSFLVFLASRYDYKKTYITAYIEGEKTRIRVAERIRKLPMSFFNDKNLTDLTNNMMGDCAITEKALSHVVPQLISNAITISLVCLLLAFYEWRLALTVFCTVPAAFLIIVLSRKLQKRLSEKYVDIKLKTSEEIQEYLDGIKVIKSCNLLGDRFTSLKDAFLRLKKMCLKMEFLGGVLFGSAQVVLQAGIGLTVFYGTYLLTGGKIELLPLLLFFLIVIKIYGPLLVELTLVPELFHMLVSLSRMKKLFSEPIMEGDAEKEVAEYNINLENVSFAYSGDLSDGGGVIEDMTISIPANGITALVGPSGSGKSTITKLIARFWDTDKGRIKIGGADIRTFDPEHLMSYMSFVFQDVVLFNDTIYNNIRIGDMDATEGQIMAAAKAACCDEFVNDLPDKYQTVLGENGKTLSGGERQRISIARALLKNAPIVLLDEATASLDPENEVLIQQAISNLIEGKTVIVIAHRLRTVAGVDKIIVIDRGRAVEEGTHETLMAKKGLYKRLYTIQQEILGWSI